MTPAKSSILVQHTITPKGSLLQLSKLDLKKITDRTRGCGGQSTHRTHHNKEDSAPKDWNDGWETFQAGKKPGSDRILLNKTQEQLGGRVGSDEPAPFIHQGYNIGLLHIHHGGR